MTGGTPKSQQQELIVCGTCQGDPRASLTCKSCGGYGIALPSVDGLLTWGVTVDDFSIQFRKIRRNITVVFHLILIIASVATIGLFAWRVSRLTHIADVWTMAFWTSGAPEITLFWAGLFLDCFIIFRLVEFTREVSLLPNWGKSRSKNDAYEKTASERANVRVDVSRYFQPQAREVVENAYRLAKDLKRNEVSLAHLFASAIASSTGAVFLTRLGLPFDKIKDPLARLIHTGDAGSPPIPLSREVKRALIMAFSDARNHSRKYVSVIELFLQSFQGDQRIQDMLDGLGFPVHHVVHVAEWIRLQDRLREDQERFAALAMLKPASVMNRSMTARQTPLLDRFSEDLTLAARNGYLPPLIGREREMSELLRAIESGRRSVVLVGENGTGRTALVEGLARRMVEEDVPPQLFDRRLVSVNLPQLVAAGDPGLASERLFSILEEVALSGNIILVLRGIEALTGGSAQGPLDLAEGLSAELDKGYFIAVGVTTPYAYTQYIERRSLGSKLTKVAVDEMGTEEAISVLMAKTGVIEYQNHVFFSYAAIDKAVALSARYMHERALPEKAIDVAREAAVLARKERGERTFVTAEDVAKIVHDKSRIPVEAVSSDESSKLLHLEEKLHKRIIGQEAAVTAVSQAMRRARAELREGKRPIANFLFMGPTGVGKTELSKALAAEYFGAETSMIRMDMSEYQDTSAIQRMIGAPNDPRGGQLTEAVRANPFSILLLDEIEKANPDILNLFLQVMDDGRLTDGNGRTIDFTNVVLIATSNAGTAFIQEEVKKGTPMEQVKTALMERELKGIFRPEFLNRFDAIIVFKPLTLDDVSQIAWLMVNGIGAQLEKKGIKFLAEDEAVEKLAAAGFDPLFGARPLRRVIQEQVDNQLADLILRKAVNRRDTVVIAADGTLKVVAAQQID
jgi:ATP-dependent Clp protease ATP-binding subunit ClpC